ncbi:MAG: DUF4430 domain-containing protein [Ruminococcus sp.]|nr:DUF4430 domain-containing protein [Ruminococcus sp.]
MNKRTIINALLVVAVMITCLFKAEAVYPAYATDRASQLYDEIISSKLESSESDSIQQWIDTELSENAGSSEWYILSLLHEGEYNFTEYRNSLEAYLSNNTVSSAVTKQKYAVILSVIAPQSPYISELSENTIGQQGVMSYIYGLHLMNSGIEVSGHTEKSVIEQLLSMQFDDGGWAVMGAYGDTDVTAMAMQALAVHMDNTSVAEALEKAVDFLSHKQNEGGDYSGYGIPNSESTAQILTALSSLSIDAESDERFIKNGNTIFDGLSLYEVSDGVYSHITGGEASELSTAQVLNSLTAYKLMKQDKGTLYTFEEESSVIKDETEEDVSYEKKQINLRLIICLSIALITIICIAVMLAGRKASKKNILFLIIVMVVAEAVVLFTDFKTADEYYDKNNIEKGEIIGTVTMTIRCDTIADIDEEYIPENGIILSECVFEIDSDDTAYDILTEASRTYSIHLESSGADGMKYINGINHIYELQYGDLSGWMYFVNGKEMSEGCDGYTVRDGDNIEWHYTLEMGKDLK